MSQRLDFITETRLRACQLWHQEETKAGPGSEERYSPCNPNMFYKSLCRHTSQSSRMGFHSPEYRGDKYIFTFILILIFNQKCCNTNRASFPHRETAWWRTKHMLQQEIMGKDLREHLILAPKNQNKFDLGQQPKGYCFLSNGASIPPLLCTELR